jgi:ribosome recycling factor
VEQRSAPSSRAWSARSSCVRNIRRDANDHLKKEQKEKKLSEDSLKDAEDNVQKLTDEHIKNVDEILKHKEKEIMEV